MSSSGDFGNPLRKFKLVFLGEQSGKWPVINSTLLFYDLLRFPYEVLLIPKIIDIIINSELKEYWSAIRYCIFIILSIDINPWLLKLIFLKFSFFLDSWKISQFRWY